jgi:uncharacterized Zn finger protein
VMQVLCRQGKGVFPPDTEISLDCSCPDGVRLCKHLAAVLYGVGARLDQEPELLFLLRGVDKMDLLGGATRGEGIGSRAKAKNALEGADLAGIFGIELGSVAQVDKPKLKSKPKRARR